MGLGQPDQPVPRFFFRAYPGSGLVIQCLARRQRMPSRLSVRRIASPVYNRGVQPRSWQTAARRSKVQRLVGFAEQAWAVVQQVLQGVGMAVVQGGPGGVGSGRFLVERAVAFAVEGMDRVADGSPGAGEVAGDLGRS